MTTTKALAYRDVSGVVVCRKKGTSFTHVASRHAAQKNTC
jgi:hypothetical protein